MMFGGILNVVLDPVFIFGCHLAVTGGGPGHGPCPTWPRWGSSWWSTAGWGGDCRLPPAPVLHLPVYGTHLLCGAGLGPGHHLGQCRQHGDGAPGRRLWGHPVAACGIVKRVDQVPLNLSMGLCQGFMPLVGYNFAAGNYRRMRQVSLFSWKTALGMSACFVACFALFAPQILHLFLPRGPDQCPGGLLPADRLPGGAVDGGELPHQLHPPGHGEGGAVSPFDLQPPGAAEHPPCCFS